MPVVRIFDPVEIFPMNPFRIVIASACFLSFAVAAEPTVPPKTPTELVVLLGDTSFRTRESAAKELVAMGAAAHAALEAGRKSGDAEVVARCDKLLGSLGERERRTRIDRFEKAEVGSEARDLPFWNLFRDAVGDTKASRKDFARMLRSHFSELIPLERDAEKLSGSHYQRIADFRTRQIEPFGSCSSTGRLLRGYPRRSSP